MKESVTLVWYLTTFWDEWLSTLCCAIITFSCFLWVNHLDRKGGWYLKGLILLLGFGAMGIALGPFFGQYSSPTLYELAFRAATATFISVKTYPLWRDLPGLNRRKHPERELLNPTGHEHWHV